MTHEITEYDETTKIEDEYISTPPLCLVHYFGANAVDPPERNPKPPGKQLICRIAGREGNLIFLEFAPPPETMQAKWQARRYDRRRQTRFTVFLFLLLLLTCILGCFVANRF